MLTVSNYTPGMENYETPTEVVPIHMTPCKLEADTCTCTSLLDTGSYVYFFHESDQINLEFSNQSSKGLVLALWRPSCREEPVFQPLFGAQNTLEGSFYIPNNTAT